MVHRISISLPKEYDLQTTRNTFSFTNSLFRQKVLEYLFVHQLPRLFVVFYT